MSTFGFLRRPAVSALVAILVFGAFGPSATAGPWAPPATDPLAVELLKIGHEKRTHFVEPVTKKTWGRGEVLVAGSMNEVRAVVMDYAHWSLFIKRFDKAKLLKKETSGAAEVFLQMKILNGAAMMWVVERFEPPVAEGKGEKIVGKMLKGNVDDLQAVWRYRPVDATHTIVTLEILVVPKMVVPETLMISQLEDAGGQGSLGVRDRVQELCGGAKKP